MTTNVKITMLGYRATGKSSYLVATVHDMQTGIDGFALAAMDKDIARDFESDWTRLCETPHAWPEPSRDFTSSQFRLTYRADTVITLTWVDHRGGDAHWLYPDDAARHKKLIDELASSDCIFLCLPGDLITKYRSDRGKLDPQQMQMASLREIISEVVSSVRPNHRNPLPIAVILTMSDYLAEDFMDALKEVMTNLAWLLDPRGRLPGPSYLVGFFPVTLGPDLHDNREGGNIEPRGVRAPVLFAAWARMRQLAAGSQTENPNYTRKASALEILEQLGRRLAGYLIAQDEKYLTDSGKLVPADRVQPPRIFVSHSSADNDFCVQLVESLKRAEADVWYDQDDMRAGDVVDQIEQGVRECPILLVVLSKDALTSPHVQRECQVADRLALKDKSRTRTVLAVTAASYDQEDIEEGSLLSRVKRIERKGRQPIPVDEAIAETLKALGLASGDYESSQESQGIILDEFIANGNALLAQRRYDEAIAMFDSALRLDAHNFDVLLRLAYAHLVNGDPVKSLTASRRARDLNEHDAQAWALMGAAYYGLGTSPTFLHEAMTAFHRALELDPHDADSWNDLGMVLYDLGRDQETLDAFTEALKYDDTVAYRWTIRGDILTRLGDQEAARDSYARALAIDSRMIDARVHNDSSSLQLGDA